MYEEEVVVEAESEQVYGIPVGLSLRGAIQAIFNFYSVSAKESTEQNNTGDDMENALDGTNFVRMCRDAPELSLSSTIQRYSVAALLLVLRGR